MKEQHITEKNIQNLIDGFYTKVKLDKELGPIFLNAIGNDSDAWKPHLQKMYDFWSSIMLGSGRYHGRPLQKHQMLPNFDILLFDRWLTLFAETAHDLYTPEIADHYIEKSNKIAESLKMGLYYSLQKSFCPSPIAKT
jgi:hemoglobin